MIELLLLLELLKGTVLLLEIVHYFIQRKINKALIESSKNSNQRLDSFEKKLRDKNS